MRNSPVLPALFPLAPVAAWVALAWPAPANAAEWTVTPGVEVRETFTDNLTLAPAGAERSDFVTEISPRLSLRGTGARMKLNAEYEMRNFFYARESGASNTHHLLQASGNAELVENLFFIEGSASAGPQSVSPFGPQVAGSGHLTGNQADVRTYSISPFLRHRFGGIATAEVRYRHDAVTADSGGLLDSRADSVRVGLTSGTDFMTLKWNVAYEQQKIDFDSSEDVDTKSVSSNLRYLLSPRIALTATAGYEDNSYTSIGRDPEGGFWSLGAAWSPSERTSIAVSAGKRFFGDTLSFNAQHRMRMTVWSAGYQEDITTTRSQFLMPSIQNTAAFLNGLWMSRIPDQAAREEQVQRFIREVGLPGTLVVPVNGFTNRVFLQKTAHASVALTGSRNTVTASIFRVDREPQSATGTSTLEEATRQEGVSAAWNWRLSSRSSVTAGAGFNRASAGVSGRKEDNVNVRIGLARQMQRHLRGGIELRRLEKRSSQSADKFRENAIAVFLQMSF